MSLHQVQRRPSTVLCGGRVGIAADIYDSGVHRGPGHMGPEGSPQTDGDVPCCVGGHWQCTGRRRHGASPTRCLTGAMFVSLSPSSWLRVSRGVCCVWQCSRHSRTLLPRVPLGAWLGCGTFALADSRCSAVLAVPVMCCRCGAAFLHFSWRAHTCVCTGDICTAGCCFDIFSHAAVLFLHGGWDAGLHGGGGLPFSCDGQRGTRLARGAVCGDAGYGCHCGAGCVGGDGWQRPGAHLVWAVDWPVRLSIDS